MGEQTQLQTETQSQTQAQIHSQSDTLPSQSDSDSALQLQPTPPADLPQNPSKIPIRPQKIRKLSSAAPVEHKTPQLADSSSTNPDAADAVNSSRNRRRGASQSSRAVQQIIRPLSANGEFELAISHLRSADPLLAPLIDTHPPPALNTHQSPFLALTKSILYQQLAFKAGTSIYTRFAELCGGEDAVRPEVILSLSSQQLKQIGISGRKASYLYDLSNKYTNGILSDETVRKMDDRSLFAMLSMVKGIGSWSVHMFMIFSLHRPDVLPVSDLGVRKGVQLLYGLDELPRPSQMEKLCEKWRPYRSVGSWYMWRFVEGKGTPTAGAAVALEGSSMQPLQQIHPQQVEEENHQHQLQLLGPVNGIGNHIG